MESNQSNLQPIDIMGIVNRVIKALRRLWILVLVLIVLGGGVSQAGHCLLEGAKKHFDKWVFHAARDVRFALASLGNDAGAYGAFKLLLDAE